MKAARTYLLLAIGALAGYFASRLSTTQTPEGPRECDRPDRDGGDFLMKPSNVSRASGMSTPGSIPETYAPDRPRTEFSPSQATKFEDYPNVGPVVLAGMIVLSLCAALAIASWISDYSTRTYVAAVLAFAGSVATFEKLSTLWSDSGVRTLRWVLAYSTILATYEWAWTSPIWGLGPTLDQLVRIVCSLLAGLCWVVPYVLDTATSRFGESHGWAMRKIGLPPGLATSSDKYLPWLGLWMLLVAALIEAFPIVQTVLQLVPEPQK